jgi:maltose alpha-D-glucosyltransferase/alpha-amylase
MTTDLTLLADDPQWYKDAIIYELRIRSFYDSNGDGIGDIPGMTAKLDYLRDLGVTAVWLLPFYPSPLRDDGYDISDYYSIHPDNGTLQDFKVFLREAHRRGIRVITELVINHTSDQHPWFQRARRAKAGSAARDFYVWSDSPEKYRDARIIFQDFETSNWTWDPLAQAYFWHRFYSHQPDLNFDNPRVKKAVFQAMDFWFKLGIDGMRLDAVPYLYEREGTNCENLPETHQFLRELRRHVDKTFKNRMLLGEANQWPEDSVAYFGKGDECHMNFHFPIMPRLYMAIHMEDRFPIIEILQDTPAIPDSCQWAMFLRNHDELTLEMVSDEERDYMRRMYAPDPRARINLGIRRRLAPLVSNNRRRLELLNGLLLSLPGTPVLYYGDEIGMGDNIHLGDRNGVRTPMQWSSDRNAGFSTTNPQRLFLPVITDPEYHYETVNVEAQHANPQSLLWWTRRIIALRKRHAAFGRGSIEFLQPDNPKVLAFLRELVPLGRQPGERILVVANLSRFAQYVELDLSRLQGHVPVEMFGQNEFPVITDRPYLLTMGPHTFYWFVLQPPPKAARGSGVAALPGMVVSGGWEDVLAPQHRAALSRVLGAFIRGKRWFGGKARKVAAVRLQEAVPLAGAGLSAYLLQLRVDYTEGLADVYQVPLAYANAKQSVALRRDHPDAIIAALSTGDRAARAGVLFDALADPAFCTALLQWVGSRKLLHGENGSAAPFTTQHFRRLQSGSKGQLRPTLVKGEQSNTTVLFGNRYVLKFFRRLHEGVSPDLEIGRFLMERGFANCPPLAGALEYRMDGGTYTLAVLQGYVANQGDAWKYTLDELDRYFEGAQTLNEHGGDPAFGPLHLLDLAQLEPTVLARDAVGPYLESVRVLGRRTAEMHLALAAETEHPDFKPEPFSTLYQRSVYQAMRGLTAQVFRLLRRNLPTLPAAVRGSAERMVRREPEVLASFNAIAQGKMEAERLRYHGDFHLGQALYTGKDFVVIDFEGEPARPLSERRIKRSPLRDVAGMLRSFSYAASSALEARTGANRTGANGSGANGNRGQRRQLERWSAFWQRWVSAVFLRAYLEGTAAAGFIPKNREHLKVLLDAFVLEKAVYELGYELNNRPAWVRIPLSGIEQLLAGSAGRSRRRAESPPG